MFMLRLVGKSGVQLLIFANIVSYPCCWILFRNTYTPVRCIRPIFFNVLSTLFEQFTIRWKRLSGRSSQEQTADIWNEIEFAVEEGREGGNTTTIRYVLSRAIVASGHLSCMHGSSSLSFLSQMTMTTTTTTFIAQLTRPRKRRSSHTYTCLLYTSPSPRDRQKSRMPSSAWKKKR